MKICPQCRAQYDIEGTECPECGCELLIEHGPDEVYPWKCVGSFPNEAMGKPVAMHLNHHGIPAVIQPRFNAIYGSWDTVDLWVPEVMADRAESLIHQRPECPDTGTLFTEKENGNI